MSPQVAQIKKVLVLYVGGTIGMEKNENYGELFLLWKLTHIFGLSSKNVNLECCFIARKHSIDM